MLQGGGIEPTTFLLILTSSCVGLLNHPLEDRIVLINSFTRCVYPDSFFNNSCYKEYLENAVSFNRKLNEERKMRLPYIDGQTGVAQRHYNSQRLKRERMPGKRPGQIYSYPQKHWKKKRYQYLRYFMQPKKLDVAELIQNGQVSSGTKAIKNIF